VVSTSRCFLLDPLLRRQSAAIFGTAGRRAFGVQRPKSSWSVSSRTYEFPPFRAGRRTSARNRNVVTRLSFQSAAQPFAEFSGSLLLDRSRPPGAAMNET
jgi:hypothetical protein